MSHGEQPDLEVIDEFNTSQVAEDTTRETLSPRQNLSPRVTSPLVNLNPPTSTPGSVSFADPIASFQEAEQDAAAAAPTMAAHPTSPFATSPSHLTPSRANNPPPIQPTPTKTAIISRAPFIFGRFDSSSSASPDLSRNRPQSQQQRRPIPLAIDAVASNMIILQQDALRNLITAIKSFPQYIFNNQNVENHEYIAPHEQSDRPRADRLIDFYYSLYQGGFQHFDKETFSILHTYLDSCATIFDTLLNPQDKTFSKQIRLLTVAIAFGIDRALTSLKLNDKLLTDFIYTPQDAQHTHIYDKPELIRKIPLIPTARDIYVQYFRTDYPDFTNVDFIPVTGIRGTTNLPVIHHSFNTPLLRDDPEPRRIFQFPDVTSTQQQQTQQRSSTFHPHQDSPRQHQKENGTPRSVPLQKDYYQPTDSDDPRQDDRRRPQGQSTQQYRTEIIHVPIGPRDSECQTDDEPPQQISKINTYIGKPRKSYRLPSCDSPEHHSSSSSSESDYDPRQSRTPLDLTPVEHAYGQRLSSAGKLHRSEYKLKARQSAVINSLKKNLERLGLSRDQQNSILATSIGIAQSINALTKEGQKLQQPEIIPPSPPPSDIDLRVNAFDYNINGLSPEEILGTRFAKLKFPNETSRLQTMRAIFQKVVDDPSTPNYNKRIALGQLGQFDHTKFAKNEFEHHYTRTLSRLDNHPDPDIIPPPLMGNNSLDGRTLKTLQTRLGMEDRVSFDDITTSLFKSILTTVSSVLSAARVTDSEAYALMKRITKGNSYETVQIHEISLKNPFKDYWIAIQKLHKNSCNTTEYKKKLKAIMTNMNPDRVDRTLNEIMIYTHKIHEKEIDPKYRQLLTQRECLRYFRFFIKLHFAPYFSQINTCFTEKLRQLALENDDVTYTNENIYHPGTVQTYLEVACDILSQIDDDIFPKSTREKTANIFAVNPAEHPQELQQTKNEPNRQNTQQSNQQVVPYQQGQQRQYQPRQQNQRDDRRTPGPRPPSRFNNQQRPQSRAVTPYRPNYNCHLCNRRGHGYRECRTYPNEERGPSYCDNCGGAHKGECRTFNRAGTPGPRNNQRQQDQQQNRSMTPYQRKAQMSYIEHQQPLQDTPFHQNQVAYIQPQPIQHQQQPPQPGNPYQQNYSQQPLQRYQPNYQPRNDGFNPSSFIPYDQQMRTNQQYRQYRPRSQGGFHNNNDNRRPRSQNGYRNIQRPYDDRNQRYNQYRGPSRSQSRNGDRLTPGPGGYRRPFFRNQYNGNNPNYEPIRPRQYNNNQQQPYQNGFQRNYNRQPDPPQHQQEKQEYPHNKNVIGNAGTQPIPIQARLAAIANETYDQQNHHQEHQQ